MKKGDSLIVLSVLILTVLGLLILASLSQNDISPFLSLKNNYFCSFRNFLFLLVSHLDWRLLNSSSALLLTSLFFNSSLP